MPITEHERLLYRAMDALYHSGVPLYFKGAMVLKAFLLEAGYQENTRHTSDIDANWIADRAPTEAEMVETIQSAFQRHGIQADVWLHRMYGSGRSAGFHFLDHDTEALLFSMDMDVNRPMASTRLYDVEGLRFAAVTPYRMLADKTLVASTPKIFRRIKDFIDLSYLSHALPYNREIVLAELQAGNRALEDFSAFRHRVPDLEHAYAKFNVGEGVPKPPFSEVYQRVSAYLRDMLPRDSTIPPT